MENEVLVFINRIAKEDKQTLGELTIDGSEEKFYTMELPWKDNQKRISCIPEGKYQVIRRWSEKYGNHFHVLDVPNRSYILIHYGNYKHNTLGCILPGSAHIDIDGDGYKDVTASKSTMGKLYNLLPERFYMEIC